jgi:hypothetical protein
MRRAIAVAAAPSPPERLHRIGRAYTAPAVPGKWLAATSASHFFYFNACLQGPSRDNEFSFEHQYERA